MCGIAGIVHADPDRPVPAEAIERMCAAIRHRGPDDEGIFRDAGAALGMRRLSIIDVAGGHQPVFNEDGSLAIVFNGEVYNYASLQQALRAHGHTFRSTGDTETVLHLYEEAGRECVSSLRGMFAFAVWDRRLRTLFLARDRFGIKPLYYALRPWGIVFASELKALLAAGQSERRLDLEALDAYLELGYLPAPLTPFADIRKLPPAHTLTWGPGRTPLIHRYWDLPQVRAEAPLHLADKVRERLDDSVAAHLVSDVPVAAFLSGGLDSSAVVASAAVQGNRLHAFSVRYAGSGAERAGDETPLAQALADRHGVTLTVVDVAPRVDDLLEPIIGALDEPHADDSAIPTWLLAREVGSRYKVALTGIGGDELFAGYRRHLGLLWSGWYGKLPMTWRRAAAALAARASEPSDGGLGVDRLKRFTRIGNGAVDERWLAMIRRLRWEERSALYRAELAGEITGKSAARIFAAHRDRGGHADGIAAGTYLDFNTFLPDDILTLSDRLSMAHGLELRVPFVDHQLAEAVFPLPAWAKVPWGKPKGLLRRAVRDRLPTAHFRAPKRGFVGPTASWLRHELRPMLEDELSPARLGRLGLFEPAAVARLLREHREGRQNREGILWALLCFSVWHRLYCEGAPSPEAFTTAGPIVATSPR